MAKPTYTPPIGALATNRYDFETHIEGLSFRHSADQIDVNPPVLINGMPYITVADALTATSSSITQLIGNGEGFITVGDGYDCWHNANGTINFDPTIPSLDTILNPIFNAIYANTVLPLQYQRIKRGGIVVIKSGTYYVVNTINVPPGITLMGEGYGTKIVNATSLVIPPTVGSPPYPKLTSTAAPVFKILPDINRLYNDGAVNSTTPYFIFERATKIMNFVLADNFVEPTILGDLNYKLPQNYAINTPLILQEPGSYLECSGMVFSGRVSFASPQVVANNGVTSYPIQLDPANPVNSGTILKVKDSFIDGFGIAGEFRGIGYNSDIVEYINNKIRIYGHLNNDSANTRYNCVLEASACNVEFNNNYIVGNGNNIISGVDIDITGASIPSSKNLMPRVSVIGNSGVVNKGPNGVSVNNNLNVKILTTNESISQTIVLATVANNTFGSDSSSQRTVVINTTALQQLDDTSMADGFVVYVSGSEEHFYLDRGSQATGIAIDNINVFATSSGFGKWIRTLYLNYGNAQINGNLTVNGMITGTIGGGSNSVSGNFSVSGNISCGGTLQVTGSQSVGNNLTVIGLTTLGTGNTAISPGAGVSYTSTNALTFPTFGTGRTALQYIPSNTGNSSSTTIYQNNATGAFEIASNCFFGLVSPGQSGWVSQDSNKEASVLSLGGTIGGNKPFSLKTRGINSISWLETDTNWNNSEQSFTWLPALFTGTGSGLWTYTDTAVVLKNTNGIATGGGSFYPYLQITGTSGHINIGQNSTLANALYADGILKAWGTIIMQGVFAPIGDWFGINPPTYSGNTSDPVHITFNNAMDNVNYNIICTASNNNSQGSGATTITSIQNITVSSFDIFILDQNGNTLPLNDYQDTLFLTIYGHIG